MNLATTLTLLAGGPGSGCRGENCGRKTLLHMTNEKNLAHVLRDGIRTGSGAKKNIVYAFENKAHSRDILWTLKNPHNPGNESDMGKKQVAIAFEPVGKVRADPEYDDYEAEEGGPLSARIHSGPVPARNIVGYYKVAHDGKLGSYKEVRS